MIYIILYLISIILIISLLYLLRDKIEILEDDISTLWKYVRKSRDAVTYMENNIKYLTTSVKTIQKDLDLTIEKLDKQKAILAEITNDYYKKR